MTGDDRADARDVDAASVDTVVGVTRIVGALIAETLVKLEPPVTVPQWRAVVVASHGPCSASAIADDLGISLSNTTRICDRLVADGLLERRPGIPDRRAVLVALTPRGRQLYTDSMSLRRRRVLGAMSRMNARDRDVLVRVLSTFGDALQAESGTLHADLW